MGGVDALSVKAFWAMTAFGKGVPCGSTVLNWCSVVLCKGCFCLALLCALGVIVSVFLVVFLLLMGYIT